MTFVGGGGCGVHSAPWLRPLLLESHTKRTATRRARRRRGGGARVFGNSVR
jgi:hypothetical protein